MSITRRKKETQDKNIGKLDNQRGKGDIQYEF